MNKYWWYSWPEEVLCLVLKKKGSFPLFTKLNTIPLLFQPRNASELCLWCFINVQEMSTITWLMWLKLLAVVEVWFPWESFMSCLWSLSLNHYQVSPWVTVLCVFMWRSQVRSASTPGKHWKRRLTNSLCCLNFGEWGKCLLEFTEHMDY